MAPLPAAAPVFICAKTLTILALPDTRTVSSALLRFHSICADEFTRRCGSSSGSQSRPVPHPCTQDFHQERRRRIAILQSRLPDPNHALLRQHDLRAHPRRRELWRSVRAVDLNRSTGSPPSRCKNLLCWRVSRLNEEKIYIYIKEKKRDSKASEKCPSKRASPMILIEEKKGNGGGSADFFFPGGVSAWMVASFLSEASGVGID